MILSLRLGVCLIVSGRLSLSSIRVLILCIVLESPSGAHFVGPLSGIPAY